MNIEQYNFTHNGFDITFSYSPFESDIIVRISKDTLHMIRKLSEIIPFEEYKDIYGVSYTVNPDVMEKALRDFIKEFKIGFTRTDW